MRAWMVICLYMSPCDGLVNCPVSHLCKLTGPPTLAPTWRQIQEEKGDDYDEEKMMKKEDDDEVKAKMKKMMTMMMMMMKAKSHNVMHYCQND